MPPSGQQKEDKDVQVQAPSHEAASVDRRPRGAGRRRWSRLQVL